MLLYNKRKLCIDNNKSNMIDVVNNESKQKVLKNTSDEKITVISDSDTDTDNDDYKLRKLSKKKIKKIKVKKTTPPKRNNKKSKKYSKNTKPIKNTKSN